MRFRNAIAAAALAFAATSSHAAAMFTVDESSVEGLGGLVNADKLNGGYVEKISFDGAGNFVTNAYADFGLFYNGDSALGGVELNNSYNMYALFSSTGTVAPLVPGVTQFTGAAGSFQLYIDVDGDTTKTLGATGADAITLGNTADDYQIAFSTDLVAANGVLVAGTGGFFDLWFDNFSLTPEGISYFVSPTPFYLRTNVDGDFDGFAVTGTQTIRGDVSAVFETPEPGSLALFGLAALGLGGSLRRRTV